MAEPVTHSSANVGPFEYLQPVEAVGCVRHLEYESSTNIWAVGTRDEAILIDCGSQPDADGAIAELEKAGWRAGAIRAIVVTHGHGDHYGGSHRLARWCGAPVWAHLAAAQTVEQPRSYYGSPICWSANLAAADREAFDATAGPGVPVARVLREGDTIEVGALRLTVLHTPGHEPGELTLWEPRRRWVFVGDLVQGGVGAAGNWLGLFTDSSAQRASLARVADLEPAWLFKGHRHPLTGADVAADLAAAARRVDAIDVAILGVLGASPSPMAIAELTRAVFKAVLDYDLVAKGIAPANYAVMSVLSFLIDLSNRGLVRRTADWAWETTRDGAGV